MHPVEKGAATAARAGAALIAAVKTAGLNAPINVFIQHVQVYAGAATVQGIVMRRAATAARAIAVEAAADLLEHNKQY
jgi:hypothetical protein